MRQKVLIHPFLFVVIHLIFFLSLDRKFSISANFQLHFSILRDDHPEGRSLSLSDFVEASDDYPEVKSFLCGESDEVTLPVLTFLLISQWKRHFESIAFDLQIVSQATGETMTYPLYSF